MGKRNAISAAIIFFLALFVIFSFNVFAQDDETSGETENTNSKVAVGAGLEWNMNSRENFAMGALLGFDINFGASFAAGFNAIFSSNFTNFSVIEPAAFFRWYFLGKGHTGFFAQAEGGVFIIFEESVSALPMGGIRAGFRFPLGQKFYIEPYGRLGYPFLFGVGAIAGMRIPDMSERRRTERREALVAELNTVIEEQNISDISIHATNRGIMITLSNIMFNADSAVLPDVELAKLREIAVVLGSINNVRIQIAGHSSRVGTPEYLLELSTARAQSVADYLISLDAVKAENISVIGYGSSRPVADNSTPQGMAANRRVEIIILEN